MIRFCKVFAVFFTAAHYILIGIVVYHCGMPIAFHVYDEIDLQSHYGVTRGPSLL
jgi:hypothetical protein